MTAPQPYMRSQDILHERCRALAIPVWRFDGEGNMASEPTHLFAQHPWLATNELRTRLRKCAAKLLTGTRLEAAASQPASMEVLPGCLVLAFGHGSGLRHASASLAMIIAEGATQSPSFQALFADAHVRGGGDAPSPLQVASASSDQVSQLLHWMHRDLRARDRERSTLDQFGEKLAQAYEETNMLFRFARTMNCVDDPAQLMGMICHQLQQTLPVKWVAVRFNQKSRGVPELAGKLIVAGDMPCDRDAFDAKVGDLIQEWGKDGWTRLLDPRDNDLARIVNSEIIADPITHDSAVIGVLLAGNKTGSDNEVSSAETQLIDALADFLGVFHENLARFAEQHALFMGTLQALTASIDAKDRYTCGHSARVALLAKQMAMKLGFEKTIAEQYHIAGLVHDVGKIGVPETVLCKPARLTDAEFEMIKRHPRIGYEILKDIPTLAPMLPGVLHHHERWDGRGYPAGLCGEEIPMVARVLALADAFDAMSSNRAYRPAISRPHVFEEINRCAGLQFDPGLARVFLTLDFAPFDAMLNHQREGERKAA